MNFLKKIIRNKIIIAHLSLFIAMALFGLMAPFSKDAMNHGINGIQMTGFRIFGATILFWIASFFTHQQKVSIRDLFIIFLASIFGNVIAQGSLIIGISLTSPINASVEVTFQPIFTMIMAAIIIYEPITYKKVIGVILGCIGAIILVLSQTNTNIIKTNIWGDIIIFAGQFCYAFYLVYFSKIIKKYNLWTFNKWMFTFASIIILPFTFNPLCNINYSTISLTTFAEIAYVIIFCTFITFLVVLYSLKFLRPTIVSAYNYIQPVVTILVSLFMGIAIFNIKHAIAIIFVFLGVWLVIKSRAKNN